MSGLLLVLDGGAHMKITFECECGNKLVVSVLPGKYAQLRDMLEKQRFHYVGAKIKDSKLEEIQISCDKCRNHITLGVD